MRVDAKEQFQALQAHLRDAGFHLNAGQPARAREALEAALAIDPACLTAQLLLRQISPTSRLPNDLRPAPASTVGDGLSVSAGRLEERVRRRRIEGRSALARASLASGDLAAARAAVDEIKALDPQSEEVALFEAQLRAPDHQAVDLPETPPSAELALPLAEPGPSDDELLVLIAGPPEPAIELPLAFVEVPEPITNHDHLETVRSSRGAWLAAAAAFMFVVLSVWSVERLRAPATQAVPQAIAVPIERPQPEASTTPRTTDTVPGAPAVRTIGAPAAEEEAPVPAPPIPMPAPPPSTANREVESIVAPPPIVSPAASPPALPPPAVVDASPAVAPPAAVAPTPAVATTPAAAPPKAVAPSPAVAAPPAVEARKPDSTIPGSASRSTIAESTLDNSAAPAPAASLPTEAVAGDESTRQVRDLLRRYRQAYQQLSAPSARQVWPGVNEAALARAFAGLEAQRLDFDTCQIQVRESVATAACRGRARFVPKIGSRYERVESRQWSFTFRRRGAEWEIESATARRP